MSFDPSGYSDDPNPPPRRPRLDDTGDEPPGIGPNRELARSRLMFPAILLLILAIFNLLLALFQTGATGYAAVISAEDVREMQASQTERIGKITENMTQDPAAKKKIQEDLGKAVAEIRAKNAGDIKTAYLAQNVPIALVGLLIAVLTLWGSVNMMRVKGFGIAMTGAILTIIPCLSVGGCCCGLGQVAGIWALVVLLTPEVKAAFQ